jgi:hypothetical protein
MRSPMRALKLESLRVQNFRTFRDLTIDRLGRVNLIVGKNNVGTTSLLEAVHFYAGGGTRGGLSSLASSRELDLLDTYRSTNRSEFGIELPAERHLFYWRPDLSEVSPNDEEIEGLPDRRFDPKDEGKPTSTHGSRGRRRPASRSDGQSDRAFQPRNLPSLYAL